MSPLELSDDAFYLLTVNLSAHPMSVYKQWALENTADENDAGDVAVSKH